MSLTKKILGPIAVILPIILILACDSSSPTAAPGTGGLGQTPEVGDTGLDQDRTAGLGVPTATPVPAAAIEATGDFAAGKVGVDQDWERFHEEFDTWRSGLISCDASSVSVRLQQFAGDFAGITEDARNLPRTSAVRSMADRLILAAEGEDEALRDLRDIWILGSVAGLEDAGFDFAQLDNLAAFELVDLARSQASVLQKEVADELSDRLARASSQGDAETFNEDSQQIGLVWDQFHKDYDSFRAQEGTLTSVETVNQLGELVDQFRNVVASVRQLPTFESTRRAAQILADAAQEEETALRNLRDTFQRFDEGAGSESNLEGGGGDGPAESSAEASDAVFIAEDPGLFNTFTSQIVLSNESRCQAQLEMADVLDEVSSRSQTELKDFEENYQLLATRWDSFHRGNPDDPDDGGYDGWRKTEGGCDRAKVVAKLGEFSLTFRDISSAVRGLTSATALRPLGELLVEAALLEEQGLKELRNSWRPFDDGAFQGLDRDRSTADKLRRQVALGVQELLERYGLLAPNTDS